MNKADIVILIADDNDGHVELIREELLDMGVGNSIIRFTDGHEIWEYLVSVYLNGSLEHPKHLILLDINMPRVDGVEVLRRIKSFEEMKHVPVVMLTTTDDPREVETCFQLGCNHFLTKPIKFNKFAATLRKLGLPLRIT